MTGRGFLGQCDRQGWECGAGSHARAVGTQGRHARSMHQARCRGSLAAVLSPSIHTSDIRTSEDAAWALIFHNGLRGFLAYPGWRITPKEGETRIEMPLKRQERKTQRE